MPVINRIADFHADMKVWRHDIHAHPEMAFNEQRTSDFVAKTLEGFGIEIHAAWRAPASSGRSASAADSVRSAFAPTWTRSPFMSGAAARTPRLTTASCMHAATTATHDAARRGTLSRGDAEFRRRRPFHLPARRGNECGGQKMVEDGLFDRFPVEAVYGMHNWPGVPAGSFASAQARSWRRTTSSRSPSQVAAPMRRCRISGMIRSSRRRP